MRIFSHDALLERMGEAAAKGDSIRARELMDKVRLFVSVSVTMRVHQI